MDEKELGKEAAQRAVMRQRSVPASQSRKALREMGGRVSNVQPPFTLGRRLPRRGPIAGEPAVAPKQETEDEQGVQEDV